MSRAAELLHRATDTVIEVAVAYTLLLSTAAGLFGAFEHKGFGDSLWWAAVTATTTGYGDISPATLGGRIVGVVLMHVSAWFIFPLITARLAAALIVNSDAFTHTEQEQLKEDLAAIRRAVEGRGSP